MTTLALIAAVLGGSRTAHAETTPTVDPKPTNWVFYKTVGVWMEARTPGFADARQLNIQPNVQNGLLYPSPDGTKLVVKTTSNFLFFYSFDPSTGQTQPMSSQRGNLRCLPAQDGQAGSAWSIDGRFFMCGGHVVDTQATTLSIIDSYSREIWGEDWLSDNSTVSAEVVYPATCTAANGTQQRPYQIVDFAPDTTGYADSASRSPTQKVLVSPACTGWAPTSDPVQSAPDGRSFVYAESNWSDSDSHRYVIASADGTKRTVAFTNGVVNGYPVYFQFPAWSPDGKLTVARYHVANAGTDDAASVLDGRYSFNLTTGRATRIPNGYYPYMSYRLDGYEAQQSTGPVVAPEAAPVVTGAPARPTDYNGWYNHPVAINWTATPATGQPLADPTNQAAFSTTSAGNGKAGQNLSDQVCDSHWVCGYGVLNLNDDEAGPTMSFTTDRPANSANWFNAPVTINYQCSEPAPYSGVASCPPNRRFTGEGQYYVSNYGSTDTSQDRAGNVSSYYQYTQTPIWIDRAGPQVTATATSTSTPVKGWYGAAVAVQVSCADPDLNPPSSANSRPSSGVANCPAGLAYSNSGTYTFAALAGQATDVAGNTGNLASGSPSQVKIDLDAPTVSMSPAGGTVPADGQVTVAATDSGSGVTSITTVLQPTGGIKTTKRTACASVASCAATTTIPSDGRTYQLQVSATDTVKNASTVATYTYTPVA